jgi:hypothetical protein
MPCFALRLAERSCGAHCMLSGSRISARMQFINVRRHQMAKKKKAAKKATKKKATKKKAKK